MTIPKYNLSQNFIQNKLQKETHTSYPYTKTGLWKANFVLLILYAWDKNNKMMQLIRANTPFVTFQLGVEHRQVMGKLYELTKMKIDLNSVSDHIFNIKVKNKLTKNKIPNSYSSTCITLTKICILPCTYRSSQFYRTKKKPTGIHFSRTLSFMSIPFNSRGVNALWFKLNAFFLFKAILFSFIKFKAIGNL